MKVGDKVFVSFSEYKIELVVIRKVLKDGVRVNRIPNPNHITNYFNKERIFSTKLELIRDCQKRLVDKIKKNVEFYNMLNDQIADAMLEKQD